MYVAIKTPDKAATVDNLRRQSARLLSNAAAGRASDRILFKANLFCLFMMEEFAVIGGGEAHT